jgi:cytochrome b561
VQPRYSALHQALHWITALCMFAILPLAWVMTATEKMTPRIEAMFNWHKTLGMIVLGVTAWRIVLRFIDRPPAYSPPLAAWDKALSHATYGLFYLTLLWMPATGFVMSTSAGYPTKLFNLIPTPLLWGKNEKLAALFGQLHAYGQWAVYALIVLHLAGVAFHVIWARDGVLGRMLPAQTAETPTT